MRARGCPAPPTVEVASLASGKLRPPAGRQEFQPADVSMVAPLHRHPLPWRWKEPTVTTTSLDTFNSRSNYARTRWREDL